MFIDSFIPQEIIRGGIDVRASLNYELTVKLTGNYKLYKGPAHFCVALSHSWVDNTIDVFPYYQYKMIEFTDVAGFKIVSNCNRGNVHVLLCMLSHQNYTQLADHMQ